MSAKKLVDAERLRDSLMHEQAKYMMSEHAQNKHTSAGFLLAVAELDSQPIVQAIPVDYILEKAKQSQIPSEERAISKLVQDWKKEGCPQ